MTPHLRTALAATAVLALLGCSKGPAVPANVSDADVTGHVMTALNQTASLKGTQITVVTTKGDVRLTGTLDSQAQIDDALRLARAADGAHAIHDELTLRK